MSTAPAKTRRPSAKDRRFAEQCKPLPPVPGETLDERVDRLDRSLDYLTRCFQDEFAVRGEGSLLIRIITQVLIPFVAISAAISLLYVQLAEWASNNFPRFERIAAVSYLTLLALVLLLLIFARSSGRLVWLNRAIDRIENRFHTSVPIRKETLTRNNLVNEWIYIWIIGALLVFIPVTFIVLRSGVANDLGVRLAIDTAGVCDGPGRIRLFTGSATCVRIQEDHAAELSDTRKHTSVGDTGMAPTFSSVETAKTPLDAQIAEIRLDATTTLALAMFVLVIGIVFGMAVWWRRNRKLRPIEVM